MSEGRDTYAFIDMQKAFDCVDRDLLFYKLQNTISMEIFTDVLNII